MPAGRALKPMMMAPAATARFTSFSVMAPAAECTTLTRTLSVVRRSSASETASAEPATSLLMITFSSSCSCSAMSLAISSRERGLLPAEGARLRRSLVLRDSAIS